MAKARQYHSDTIQMILDEASPAMIKWVVEISCIIDDAMKKKGLTEEQTARLLGVSPATMSNFLGLGYNYTLKQLCKIEEKLGITLINVPNHEQSTE